MNYELFNLENIQIIFLEINCCDPESQYTVYIVYYITVKLLHSSLILVVGVSVKKALDGSRRYSMSAQLISLFQHFLNIILSKIYIDLFLVIFHFFTYTSLL